MEKVLSEFWRDVPDLTLREGENFQQSAVEPLTQSLLEPRREGAPWTTQRLCELLAQPRASYKSTRKFMYALQRAILITTTEEALAPRAVPVLQLSGPGGLLLDAAEGRATETTTAAAISAAATLPPDSEGVATLQGDTLTEAPKEDGTESQAPASTPTARKRKLPEELANGAVEE
ncbi:PPP4R2r [Symbiodinium natans]|uniref:PPP4R2r protein n=1 Tax=Symbiodinium natans TaxID=878477 RepID=A0A812STD3_9DINO|nr:PPP4R2r [Symbiodinium natans]